MDSGLVSSLSGALAQSKKIENIANNLANADSPGFKTKDLVFEEALIAAHQDDTRTDIPQRPYKESELLSRRGDENKVVLYGNEFMRLRQGDFKETHNPLDLAIQGNGFFEVKSPDGVRLTRAGNMAVDAQGRLVTSDGFLVLSARNAGQSGPGVKPETRAIQLPPGSLNIDYDGNIYSENAQGAQLIAKLSVLQIENTESLKPEGRNLFTFDESALARTSVGARAPAAVGPNPAVPTKANPLGTTLIAPKIHQGMVELSNVNPVSEMTEMIKAHRMYDQNLKLMQSFGDMNQRLSEVGKF
jgi:flagellar basal-body rod protein FlgF